jgi:serine/threonine-protein kinase
VALHDFGQDDEGNLFIAMEYCEGVDLKKVLAEQKRLPLAEGVEIVLQVADVLANAHNKGVVHRDLKPENIMIRRGMRGVHAKVLDFGIARLMDAGTKLTQAGAIAGTPRYMSPEQVEGREADLRADIYSLGVVLFEVLTGRQPFDGATIAEILRKQVMEPLPPLGQFAPELEIPALEAVVQKACAKRRDERFPDMLTFASALSQALPTQAHLALPPLQRHDVQVRDTATPSPGAFTGHASGVAVPGAPTSPADLNAATLLRTPDPSAAAALTGLQLTPSPSGGPAGHTQVELAPKGSVGTQVSPPLAQAPASKAPLFVGVGVAAAALLVVAVVLTRPPAPATITPPPPVVVPLPSVPPPPHDDVTAVTQAAVEKLDEAAAKNSLTQGQTAFEAGNLDAAETYAGAVPAHSTFRPEAEKILGTLKSIREQLQKAAALKNSGQCEAAVPHYREVLKLNAHVPAALQGIEYCNAAHITTTLE